MKISAHVSAEESTSGVSKEVSQGSSQSGLQLHSQAHTQAHSKTSWGRRFILRMQGIRFFKRFMFSQKSGSSQRVPISQTPGEPPPHNACHHASYHDPSSLLITQGRLIDTQHSYRAFAWVSRILGFGLLNSILVNIIFAVLFLNLFPLKRVEPLLLTVSPKSDQIVRIEPFDAETNGFDVMTESLARDYVKMREAIDFQTETERWESIYWLSEPPVFETFKNIMQGQGQGAQGQSVYETRQRDNVTRSLSITSVSTLSKDPRILQVEWQSIDAELGLEIKRTRWISTLTIQYKPSEVKFEDRYMNPLGFVVVAYGVSEKQGEKE